MAEAAKTTGADFDYSDDVEAKKLTSDKLSQLAELAKQQEELEAEYAKAENALKIAADRLRQVREVEIPALMEEVGMQTVTTASGLRVEVGETMRCGIAKDRKAEAHKWLEDHGVGDIIKNSLVISFPRDEQRWFEKFQRDLRQRKRPVDSERTSKVEGSTLRKCLEELIARGIDVPAKLFGLHFQKAAKIKRVEKE